MLAKLDQAIAEYEQQKPVYAYVRGECPDLEKCEDRRALWEMEDAKRMTV